MTDIQCIELYDIENTPEGKQSTLKQTSGDNCKHVFTLDCQIDLARDLPQINVQAIPNLCY